MGNADPTRVTEQMKEESPQRQFELRDLYNALRWLARAGAPWRPLPANFPPWEVVCQQTQRWLRAGCFEAMTDDLRSIIRVAHGRQGQRSDSRWADVAIDVRERSTRRI